MYYTCKQLFEMCNQDIKYETAGDAVNYAFLEIKEEVKGRHLNSLYIFFQPSRGKKDWRNNFAFWRKPYKDMEVPYFVHGGFLKCWKTVEDIIIEKVTEKECATDAYKWHRVVVVGYSHGAALAALCHECVWFHRPDLRAHGLKGLGFDGPRIYAGFFIRPKVAERWRDFIMFRNQNDIVTHVPPVLFGFRHVGFVMPIGANEKHVNCVRAHYPDKIAAALETFDNEWDSKY